MKKLARVFARKTSMTPIDADVYFGYPTFFDPKYKQVHVSVTFTWDIKRGHDLKRQWGTVCNNVKIGGPAFDDPGSKFVAGRYLKKRITITSRGGIYSCDFCLVPKREGDLKELSIFPGHIIQDNNILACSKTHISKVFQMLKTQKRVRFSGGLDARLLKDWHIQEMRSLSIDELWFACDYPAAFKRLIPIAEKLKKAGFKRYQIRCYVLIGHQMEKESDRLKELYKLGFYPFAQLYRDGNDSIKYNTDWKEFQNIWSRPARYKALMKTNEKSHIPDCIL